VELNAAGLPAWQCGGTACLAVCTLCIDGNQWKNFIAWVISFRWASQNVVDAGDSWPGLREVLTESALTLHAAMRRNARPLPAHRQLRNRLKTEWRE
jgi:hypothetical protein